MAPTKKGRNTQPQALNGTWRSNQSLDPESPAIITNNLIDTVINGSTDPCNTQAGPSLGPATTASFTASATQPLQRRSLLVTNTKSNDSPNNLDGPIITATTTSTTTWRRRTASLPEVLKEINQEAFPTFGQRQPSLVPRSESTLLSSLTRFNPYETSPEPPAVLQRLYQEAKPTTEPLDVTAEDLKLPKIHPRTMAANGAPAGPSGSEPLRSETRDTPGQQDIRYSKNAWKVDGTFVYQVAKEINNGNLTKIRPLLRQSDIATVKAIIRLIDSEKREDYQARAILRVYEQGSPTANPALFAKFLTRFRNRPSEDLEASPGHSRRSQSQSQQPPGEKGKGRATGNANARQSGFHKHTAGGGGYPNPDDEPSDDNDNNPTPRNPYQARKTPHRNEDRHYSDHRHNDHLDDRFKDDRFKGTPHQTARYTHVKRLRADELGTFDETNPTALAYTRRLNYLANTYSEEAILATLPVCMKGDALEWLTGLEEETTMMMSDNLHKWKV
jgi:hypothetical protein